MFWKKYSNNQLCGPKYLKANYINFWSQLKCAEPGTSAQPSVDNMYTNAFDNLQYASVAHFICSFRKTSIQCIFIKLIIQIMEI